MSDTHDPVVPGSPWLYVGLAAVLTVELVQWRTELGRWPLIVAGLVGLVAADLAIAAARLRHRHHFRKLGPWVHHGADLHTCTRHPSAHHLTEVEAAKHMRDRHPDKWAMLAGNVQQLSNRRERRGAGDLVTKPRTRVTHEGRTTRKAG